MICKNCENKLTGDFCSNCGQKSRVEKINLRYLLNELPNSIFQVNRGFLFTIKELCFRPGHSIREYLSGKRVSHYKPIGFFLITSTIYVVSTYLLGEKTFIFDFLSGIIERGSDAGNNVSDKTYLEKISSYQVYIPLVILPLFSLATCLAFIKSKYNYFEHLVINLYITGQQMIIYSIFGSLFQQENILMIAPLVLGMIYNFWVFNQIFEDKKFLTKLGLITLSYIIILIGIIIMAAILGLFVRIMQLSS